MKDLKNINERLQVYNKDELCRLFCKRFFNLDGDINNIKSNINLKDNELISKLNI